MTNTMKFQGTLPRISKMTIMVVLSLTFNLYLLCTEDMDDEKFQLKFQEALESRPNTEQSPHLLLAGLEWDEEEQSHVNSLGMRPEEVIEVMEKTSQNLPIAFIERSRDRTLRLTNECARFPSVYDILFSSIYWQRLPTPKGMIYLYGAYYDNRILEPQRPVVRLLAIMNTAKGLPQTICQFWFDEQDTPVFSDASYSYIWGKRWNFQNDRDLKPYLISCSVPKSHHHLIPQAVSLVQSTCDSATNSLRVIYNLPENGTQQDFAVCVKGFDFYFQDNTKRLVEWLGLLSALGAHKVFYYSLSMNAKMEKMMKYYEDKGFVEVIPTTLPGSQPNVPGLFFKYVLVKDKFQHEVIQFNDCYYRNLYRYKYTVHLDTDEVIVPRFATKWQDLMQTVTKKSAKDNLTYTSYCARHTFFMDHMRPSQEWLKDIPSQLHILQHVIRSANFSPVSYSIKCFHSTANALHVHNHFPLLALGETYPFTYHIPTHDAQLNHYRQNCQKYVANCYETFKRFTVFDPIVWKYKDTLITEVNKTFSDLGYW